MKKMIWSMPQMHEVQFEANEYVSVCVTAASVLTKKNQLPPIEGVNWNQNGVTVKYSNNVEYIIGNGNQQTGALELPFSTDDKSLQADTAFNSGAVYDVLEYRNGENVVVFDDEQKKQIPQLFVAHDGQAFLSTGFTRTSGYWS